MRSKFIKLKSYLSSKLPLDNLQQVQYRNSTQSTSFLEDPHEVEEVSFLDDVYIIMEEGKKLTWYLACV
jgi:hypothetical protein